MIVVGIDYSMTSPAICVHEGLKWSFNNCKFHFLSAKKKFLFPDKKFFATPQSEFFTQEERFNNIATWAVSNIPISSGIFLEGYSFGSKGVVFNIAENTGVLKNKLYLRPGFCSINVVPPTTIKKFATGKGNANKELMHEAFIKETKFNIDKHFDCTIGESPISDIIDSYYIAKYGFEFIGK